MTKDSGSDLYSLIVKYQEGDREAFIDIYLMFLPLIKKYARKLKYDGSDSDMTIALLEIVKRIPTTNMKVEGTLIGYINKSIINKYFYLSKKYSLVSRSEIAIDTDIDYESEYIDQDERIIIRAALDGLTKKEKEILILKYVKGYSDAEIAESFNVSRQAVNKAKNRALDNVRKNM